MNSNENENNLITIDLENLQKRYSNILTQYKQSVTDYINYLNQNTAKNNKSFVNIKGQSYLGTGTLQQINNTNLNNCQVLCKNDTKCSGATFQSNICILKTGDSSIIPSSNDSYAIITEGKNFLMNMENLNQELININEKINNKLNKLEPYLNNNRVDIKNNTIELIQNYKELMKEKENILKLLNDYNTLDNTQNEDELKVTQNYYFYILYFVVIIIILYLLYKISYMSSSSNIQYGGQLGATSYYIVFFIILLSYLLFIYI